MSLSERQVLPRAAVLGAGFLGSRIAGELLLSGVEVSIYDKALSSAGPEQGQVRLEEKVYAVVSECAASGLLALADMNAPPRSGPWEVHPGEGTCKLKCCSSIAEAVRSADIVIECLPDDMAIKILSLAEAWAEAPPGVLLATSTVTIPVKEVRSGLETFVQRSKKHSQLLKSSQPPRMVGLRFLAPVLFMPYVEVTLAKEQLGGADHSEIMEIMGSWSKSVFHPEAGTRKRLITRRRQFAFEQQQNEARARNHSVALPATPFRGALYCVDKCCVCLDAAPTVTSLHCGHCVLCEDCASLLEESKGSRCRCPLCRVPFKRLSHVLQSRPSLCSCDGGADEAMVRFSSESSADNESAKPRLSRIVSL